MNNEHKYLQWFSSQTKSIYWHDSAVRAEQQAAFANGATGMTTNPFLIKAGIRGLRRGRRAAGAAGTGVVVEGRMRISAGETMGFMGFLAAGMAGNNPLLLILSALLIGGLTVAGNGMEINTGLPAATMQILIMLVLLTIMTVGGKRKA